MVSSATASAFLPGVLTTGIPRSVAAATSTFTRPPRAQQTSRSRPASRTSELTGAPWTMSTSCPATARAMSAGSPTYSRSRCSDSVRGGANPTPSICIEVTSTMSPSPARGSA